MLDLNELVWVKLPDREAFLKIKETLTRIGVASKKDKILYQSCHILHKKGRYAIIHFKELFALDGKKTDFTEEDKARRNSIANLLADWGLLTLEDPKKTAEPTAALCLIKIISFDDKKSGEWQLVSKYNVGKTINKEK
jgi:hypothetical protein